MITTSQFKAQTTVSGQWNSGDILERFLTLVNADDADVNVVRRGSNGQKLTSIPVLGVDVVDTDSLVGGGAGATATDIGTAVNSQMKASAQPVNLALSGTALSANSGAPNAQTLRTIGATATTGAGSSVTTATSNSLLLAALATRIGATIYNESTAILYVAYGFTSSTTNYSVQIAPNGYLEIPPSFTSLAMNGVWSAVNGNARITSVS
jgi:cytoskeletal protein RodZ